MGSKNISVKEISIHVLFWSLYVLLEYLANMVHLSPGKGMIFLRSTLLSLPVLMIPTYFISLFAVPRFLQQKKFLYFILCLSVAIVFIFFARIKWMELVNYINEGQYWKMPASKMLKNIIRDYSMVALAVCIYIISDWRKKQGLNEQLIKVKAEAELKLLKGQLHPHFLFNTLNNIYSLALQKSNLTADSILKLTALLDYLVYWANKEKVALSKEVELLESYLDLEKLRYGEKLKLNAVFSTINDKIKVSPLILLPFVENCFKHGGASKSDIFWINLKLKTYDDKFVFNIENSKKKKINKTINGGVGLQNIKQRLALVYPGKHSLKIEDNEDFFSVRLEVII
jgi:two-component system, LytTR family, sensor kinase